MGKILAHPFTPLSMFAAVLTALLSTYYAAGLEPSEPFVIVAASLWLFLLAIWIVADARRRTGIPCFDFGFFCYMFLPVALPWYCFWSRGWRGAITLIAITALWLGPYLAASIVWIYLYG